MNSTRKKLLILLGCFIGIILIIVVCTAILGNSDEDDNNKKTISASFYPIYIIVENITSDISEINVVNITSNTTGCLHDYQLTTSDMKKLEKSDALVINGAGMEGFVQDAAKAYPNLPVIDSSKNISLLEGGCSHKHEHSEDEHEEDIDHTDCDHNSHIWLNTNNYIVQVQNICNELTNLFPEYSEEFQSNTESYIAKVKDIQNELSTITYPEDTEIIIFHDAIAYLADETGLCVNSCFDIDDESALSAGDVAEAIDDINANGIKLLFTEEQYKTTIADNISAETGAQVFVIDTLVNGDGSKDSYINGMKNNIEVLKKSLEALQ